MATLVLSTVGTLVGGPIGGAIGAILGNQLDRAVLQPKGRQGPRLGDLSVQTSSYGNALPKLFGTMRVAGTVIWATDLREDVHHSGGGKSSAKTTTYSYSASFAVALSARPIRSVGRIWADGNLLRGAAGDWKSETGFRLYLGEDDQPVDPLIASAEGIDATPAHRGIAYAVFDTMQLADFGNRIPVLTFEISADNGDVPVGAIAAELSDGAIAGDMAQAVSGYAAGGDSVRGALEVLASACPMSLHDDGTALQLNDPTLNVLDERTGGSSFDGSAQPRHVRDWHDAGALPDTVSITYYEPARDYQAGLQRARRDGIGRTENRIDLAAAIPADLARTLAEAALTRAWASRAQATIRLPWRSLDLRPGALVSFDGVDRWRVSGWTLERMVLELVLRRESASPLALPGADAGRAVAGIDQLAGATRLAVLDLPDLQDGAATAPRVWLAAAGTGTGWRRAQASISLDDGASWQAAGQTALPAVMGSAATVLGPGAAALFDRAGSVEIALLHAGMSLQGASDDALIGGANLALLGDELIQFGAATQIGECRFRLSRLLRGRRGSEWAIGAHAVGECFVLLDPATLLALDVPLSAVGATLQVSALGPGDVAAATAQTRVVGRALRPPHPVHLRPARQPDGSTRLDWVRRSRAGWAWSDGVDAPLGEDKERYRLTINPSGEAGQTVEVSGPSYVLAGSATHFDVSLEQLGTRGASLPAAQAHFDC